MAPLRAPFPWFGGKSRAASAIWLAFGHVSNYVEPFAGSLAVLLARPGTPTTETVNDLDGFISNFWRALQADPEAVIAACDWPVNETDLHARHAWLVMQRLDLTERLMGDPEFFDARIAGWWVWGLCQWIGSGWCSGEGPWVQQDGQLTHLGDAGQGVHRQLTHLGNAGRGVHRQLTHLGNAGRELLALAARLRFVRVACGDWTRVLGPSVTHNHGATGILLDPPYPSSEHAADYSVTSDVWDAVVDWCEQEGGHPDLRVVLCGYDGCRAPAGWRVQSWKAQGGYGSQGTGRGRANARRETLWLSPACLTQPSLFEATA